MWGNAVISVSKLHPRVQATYAIHFETNEEILLKARLVLGRPRIGYRLDERRICVGF